MPGSRKFSFSVGAADISTMNLTFENGKETIQTPFVKGGAKPVVVVTDKDGNALIEGWDYTLSYGKNKQLGAGAKVTVKGKGNFGSKKDLFFGVEAKSISQPQNPVSPTVICSMVATRKEMIAPEAGPKIIAAMPTIASLASKVRNETFILKVNVTA